MTTPSDNTPASIIQDAYLDAGKLQVGASLNGEMLANGMRKLNELVNLWQTQGCKLWLNVDTSITLVAGTGLYTLGAAGTVVMTKPLRVFEAYHLTAAGVRRPLNALSWSDYVRLSQINQSGTINSYFVDKQATTLNVFFWNPPDATDAAGTAHVVLHTQVTNPISITETMNFPAEWRIALRWGLADEICTGQPQSIMDRCQQRAAAYRDALESWDVEDTSVRFAPDNQGRTGGSFR